MFFDMAVSRRDAEYIVECLRLILVAHPGMVLCLAYGEISDLAIGVFGRFLRETHCHLHDIWSWNLPDQQTRRLLAALHTNRSVKKLCIYKLLDNEGASWSANLLLHKTDIAYLHFHFQLCRFPLKQILPLLRGQPHLKKLIFINSNDDPVDPEGDDDDDDDDESLDDDLLLFNDPEFTQLFVDNVLLRPPRTLKTLCLDSCGVSLENQPLMAGFHKNTTIVELSSEHDAAIRRYIDPIMRRNRYLEHGHGLLGRTTTPSTFPPTAAGLDERAAIVAPTTPLGLWATVLEKVGRNDTQGSSPVFTILCNRLATWIPP
jgi:hypothetical protein